MQQSDRRGPIAGPLSLGIDTGGTYTDAVIWSEGDGIVAKAKALTTRHDLAVGISGAARRAISDAGIEPRSIGLVSMSTTLATNALVEGQGGRACLVMIGFGPGDLARDGLAAALGDDPVLFLPGGHDVHGNASPLDLSLLSEALADGLGRQVTGFAVAAYFAVRNPEHELAAGDLIRQGTDLPVTCSHELSSRLGGPRRALTTLLNARLVAMITRLIESTERFMRESGIAAPLMVVRGDGALIASGLARRRPIETILSGPAASLVGARHLTGLEKAIVSDIGGTTTDIAILENGRPRLDPEGATVGGHRTMVEAVAMRTFGLGGDSEVSVAEGALVSRLAIGPGRVVPLSLAAHLHGTAVRDMLERQLADANPGRHDGRFALRAGVPESFAAGLSLSEARLLERIGDDPRPLEGIIDSSFQNAVLTRLVRRGLVQIAALTPSDAAHVLSLQDTWDRRAAWLGTALLARRRDGRGAPVGPTPEALAERILETLRLRSAEAILETALIEDGLDGTALVASPLVGRALAGSGGIFRCTASLDRPVIGLGASARLHYAGLGALVGAKIVVPEDADVANALGAVAGRVSASVRAVVSQPAQGVFRVTVGAILEDFRSEEDACAFAEREASALAVERAKAAGTDLPTVSLRRDTDTAPIEGGRMFIEARITATASGRPRIAMPGGGESARRPWN